MADGRNLPWTDGAFDVCYSNSVIEHLGNWEDQCRFAREVRRVGRAYYVQTPNFWFPVEPHYLTPFVHWLPKGVRRRIVRRVTVWGIITRPDQNYCSRLVDEIRLLTLREMKALFPDAEIRVERAAGLVKSLIAVKR